MTQKERVLDALRDGPKTNAWLAENVCLRYGARIWELNNNDGYIITCRHVPKKGGLFVYELKGRKE
jgi:hypothetical protein